VAGACAVVASDALMNPFDVVKQRMQVHNSAFRSIGACARSVYASEGLAAFYVSYPTTLTMSVPFTAAQFTVYEHLKKALNPGGAYSPLTHIICGGTAGGVAAALTTPLDVAKTLLQTRGTSSQPDIRAARGMWDALRIIGRRDGWRGYTRGLAPRVVTYMPSNALCWLFYEFFSSSPAPFSCGRRADARCREGNRPPIRGRHTAAGYACMPVSSTCFCCLSRRVMIRPIVHCSIVHGSERGRNIRCRSRACAR
jgi:hypothetical protein